MRAHVPAADRYRRHMSDAAADRYFRPALVASLADGFVAVDDAQPVALFVDGRGRCSEPVSWRHVPPATTWDWPPRSLARDGSGVRVHDQSDGPTVLLSRTSAGLQVSTAMPGGPGEPVLARSRLGMPDGNTITADGRTVNYRSSLRGPVWEYSVTLDETDGVTVVLSSGTGAITSRAEGADGALAVCVRRAQKRPWEFRPAFDLIVIPRADLEAVTVRGTDLPITNLCWPRRPVDLRAVLADYLPFVLAECTRVREIGAEDVRFTVRELDRGPVIDIEFRLDGTRYVRSDEPLDELGRPGGLSAWSIFLDDDLEAGSHLRNPPDDQGVIRL